MQFVARRWFASTSAGVAAGRRYSSTNYHQVNSEILNCKSAFQIEQYIFRSRDFNHVNVATAFRTLAKLESTNPMAVEVLVDFASHCSLENSFEPRNLSSICHSIAKANLWKDIPKEFVQRIERANVAEFRPQAFTNTLWAFGRLVHKCPPVFKKFGSEVHHLQDFSPQELSTVLWSFAKVDERHNEFFTRVVQEILRRRELNKFNHQALSNVVWSCAKLGFKHDDLCVAVSDEVLCRDDFDAQAVSNMIWAFEKLEYDYPSLLDKMSNTNLNV